MDDSGLAYLILLVLIAMVCVAVIVNTNQIDAARHEVFLNGPGLTVSQVNDIFDKHHSNFPVLYTRENKQQYLKSYGMIMELDGEVVSDIYFEGKTPEWALKKSPLTAEKTESAL